MDPSKTERKSTVGAVFGFILIGVAVIEAIALLVSFPQILENLVMVCIVIGGAITLIAIGIGLVALFLTLPMYAKKGVEYQTDISYNLDDVKDVDGKMEGKE